MVISLTYRPQIYFPALWINPSVCFPQFILFSLSKILLDISQTSASPSFQPSWFKPKFHPKISLWPAYRISRKSIKSTFFIGGGGHYVLFATIDDVYAQQSFFEKTLPNSSAAFSRLERRWINGLHARTLNEIVMHLAETRLGSWYAHDKSYWKGLRTFAQDLGYQEGLQSVQGQIEMFRLWV